MPFIISDWLPGLGDDEALALFRKFLADYPVSPLRADVMMSVGDYWFNRGNYAEALQEYARSTLSHSPETAAMT